MTPWIGICACAYTCKSQPRRTLVSKEMDNHAHNAEVDIAQNPESTKGLTNVNHDDYRIEEVPA